MRFAVVCFLIFGIPACAVEEEREAPTTTPAPETGNDARGQHQEEEEQPPASTHEPAKVDPPSQAPQPPAALTCIVGHYVGSVARGAGEKWVVRLDDGTELPWNDGAQKTYDQKLETADLEDVLSIPYTMGPIVPITTPNLDPGRIRNDALLKATFGNTADAVRAKLVDVDFVGQKVKFQSARGAATALGNVSTKLKALIAQTPAYAAYVTGELGGTFEWRPILNTNRMSAHSYGIAIDIVVSKSDYWEWDKKPDGSFTWTNRIPQAIVDAFESEGFAWGGRWNHYDTMHFEYRPELFDNHCAL